ncbi:excalibur calcium-binding domain-containing protein [Sphingomonas sp. IW22]|uniref:excalibur calcium-binding domain-containing protein n=1 Tax=Sphingomonas sp. IW22 TaxID=3242489 RepID=UPI0035216376
MRSGSPLTRRHLYAALLAALAVGVPLDDASAQSRRAGYQSQPSRSQRSIGSRTSGDARSFAGAGTYRSCAEARAAGVAPLRVGDDGYSTRIDRDRDGVACE